MLLLHLWLLCRLYGGLCTQSHRLGIGKGVKAWCLAPLLLRYLWLLLLHLWLLLLYLWLLWHSLQLTGWRLTASWVLRRGLVSLQFGGRQGGAMECKPALWICSLV